MTLDIIIDSREQRPFEFISSAVNSTTVRKLNTGDYSLEGFEDTLCIERKDSVAEFYNNITQKRFWAEMERMEKFKHKFLLFEFSVSQVEMFPYGADLPKHVVSKLKISSAYLMKCIARIQIGYGVHVLFGENRDNSIYLITNIMKQVYERECKDS